MRYPPHLVTSLTALLLAGCAGDYSMREQVIRGKLPQEFRSYAKGIVARPTDADIQVAIALGTASKDEDTLEYAYLTKAPRNMFDTDDIYIRVATPLYLIANHAKEQARNYRKLDDSFVQYALGLRAVRISISQQYISTVTWDTYGFQREVALLRDGVRVEPLREIPAWAGQNPFADKPSKQMQSALSQVGQTAAQFSRGFAANMTKEQKEQVLRSYQAMGLSEEQMVAYTGFSREEMQGLLGTSASAGSGKVVLSEFDAVFPIEQLTMPGHYELVFRTPPTGSLFARGDKEIRFPISFAGFR